MFTVFRDAFICRIKVWTLFVYCKYYLILLLTVYLMVGLFWHHLTKLIFLVYRQQRTRTYNHQFFFFLEEKKYSVVLVWWPTFTWIPLPFSAGGKWRGMCGSCRRVEGMVNSFRRGGRWKLACDWRQIKHAEICHLLLLNVVIIFVISLLFSNFNVTYR